MDIVRKFKSRVSPKKKPPKQITSLKISCKKFDVWITGDRASISMGVSKIEEGFSYKDEFCTIDRGLITNLNQNTIVIGHTSFRFKTIKNAECDYSFWELFEYLTLLGKKIDSEVE